MLPKNLSNTRSAIIQMHLAVILWGITGVLGRSIDLSEGLLVWYRLLLTTITLLIYALWTKRFFIPDRKSFMQMTFAGSLIMIHWVFFYAAIKYSNISITLSMLASQALFTSLFEWLFFGQPLKRSDLFFGALAMVGIWIIFMSEGDVYFTGIILSLIATLVGTFFNIVNKPIVEKHDTTMVSLVEIFTGFLILSAILPFYISYFDIEKILPTSQDWLLLGILAFLCTHLTMVLSLNALRYLDPFALNLANNLEPVYGIALAAVIFHEHKLLSTRFYIGGAVIVLSVILNGYYETKAAREKAKGELSVSK